MTHPTNKQIKFALAAGIEVTEDMTQAQLGKLLDGLPATEPQIELVTLVMEAMGWPLPSDITYVQARRILGEVMPRVCEQVLLEKNWTRGTILKWQDDYYLVDKIHRNYSFTLTPVRLVRTANNESITVHRIASAPKRVRYPFTLRDEAVKVTQLRPL